MCRVLYLTLPTEPRHEEGSTETLADATTDASPSGHVFSSPSGFIVSKRQNLPTQSHYVHAAQTSKKLAALSITRSKGKVAMGMVSEIPKSRTISILDMHDLQHLYQLMSHCLH